jgi:hypothetical protein
VGWVVCVCVGGVGWVGLNYVYMLRIGVCECIVMTRSCIVFFMAYSSCSLSWTTPPISMYSVGRIDS